MGRDFPPVQTGPGAHPASCTMGTGSFPGVKYGRGVLLITHPLLMPWSWKSRIIPLPTLWAATGPVTGTLYRYLHLVFHFKSLHEVRLEEYRQWGLRKEFVSSDYFILLCDFHAGLLYLAIIARSMLITTSSIVCKRSLNLLRSFGYQLRNGLVSTGIIIAIDSKRSQTD